MKKTLIGIAALAVLLAGQAFAQQQTVSGKKQLFTKAELETWDRENVAGGTGTLAGKFSWTRNDADPAWVIREIGWMTLKPGDFIGLHAHAENDDAYIIVSGTGEFTDSAGKTAPVSEGDVTIAHPGQSHGLKNTGKEPLVFLDIVSKNVVWTDAQKKAFATEPQLFKKASLKSWDRQDVAGGKGTLAGKFSYDRNDKKTFTVYEIGWMTLKPGDFIGSHAHNNNEDAYIIVSGTGEFSDTAGTVSPVAESDVTIARPGQSHGLKNTGKKPLVFLDIVAK
jgi:mannose-6-phosphate isomerase-like protein (cupin superfamily)